MPKIGQFMYKSSILLKHYWNSVAPENGKKIAE